MKHNATNSTRSYFIRNFSKYPIVESETLSFKNQYFFEQFGTNRGMLYGRVVVGSQAGP